MGTSSESMVASASRDIDPSSKYLDQLLSDLESMSIRQSGSAAICLGAFARLGKLDDELPRIVSVLARTIRSDKLDELDLWLCSTALRTVVCSNLAECTGCVAALWGLMRHRSDVVVADVSFALSGLEKNSPEQLTVPCKAWAPEKLP